MPVKFGPRPLGFSRRHFLALASTACLGAHKPTAKGTNFPSEQKRFADATTEFPVTRLTSPTYSSLLPAYYNQASVARNSILFSSDRAGAMDAYRIELKSGVMRRLTEAEHLDPMSLTVLPGERTFCYCDGPSVRQAFLANLREREIYRTSAGVERLPGFTVSHDGATGFLVERSSSRYRLRVIALARGSAITAIELTDAISAPLPRPARGQTLYRRADGSVWMVGFDGKGNIRLKLPEGRIGPAYWSADGDSLLYLHMPEQRGQLNAIRELVPESGEDKLVAKTTQFAQFAPNLDASVFVGASGSRATPHVYILVRSVRRELTLCEHRAKDPATVAPIFAMNSQRIVFESDRDGKPALYMLGVERLVEETES